MKKLLLSIFIFSTTTIIAQKDTLKSGVYSWNAVTATKEETRDRRELMEGNTLDLGYFEIHASTIDPGKAPHPPHTHGDTEEIIIVRTGQLKVTIAGHSKILGPGSVALAVPGDEHGVENAGTVPSTYYILKMKSKTPMNMDRAKKAGGSIMVSWDDMVADKTGKGVHRSIFDRASSQFGKLEMHETTLNKGEVSHDPHTHRAEELILLKKGEVQMLIGGKFYRGVAGDLFLLNSNVQHGLINTGGEPCEYFAFQWQN